MSSPFLYGQANSEKQADENRNCREIVKEINNFGISQRQAMLVIYLLASELENVEHMRAITRLVRELQPDMFLIGAPEPDTEITGDDNGPAIV